MTDRNSLFDENHKYTSHADSIEDEITKHLSDLFKHFCETKGFSPREVSHIVMLQTFMIEADTIMHLESEKLEREKQEKIKPGVRVKIKGLSRDVGAIVVHLSQLRRKVWCSWLNDRDFPCGGWYDASELTIVEE